MAVHIHGLRATIVTLRQTKKEKGRRRLLGEIEALLQELKPTGKQTVTAPVRTSDGVITKGTTGGGVAPALGGSAAKGRAFALRNRLPGLHRGLSFEQSVGLRELDRRQQRRVVSEVDRVTSSGSAEEY